MRQGHFESIIAVQNRHIERLEKMVEQLYGALRDSKRELIFSRPEVTSEAPDYEMQELANSPMPFDESGLIGSTTYRP